MQTPRLGSREPPRGRLVRRSDEARTALLAGVDCVADAVAPTLGPCGRPVALQRPDAPPLITTDGVTIARSLEMLSDPILNQGVQLLRQASSEAETLVGDGTTTATVLARALLHEAVRAVEAGAEPVALERALGEATGVVERWLRSRAEPLDGDEHMLGRVAAIAARDERIGALVAEALQQVGAEGVVRIEDAHAYGVHLTLREGMQFENGLLSPGLVVDQLRGETVFEWPYVALVQERITQVRQLSPLLSQVAEAQRPIVLIADELSGDALTLLVLNVARRRVPVAAVKAPEFGADREEALRDLATWSGGTVLGTALGRSLEHAKLEDLGQAKRALLTRETTALIDGAGTSEEVSERCASIEGEVRRIESDYERTKRRTRLARLAGAIAVIGVGSDTQVEQEEIRHRVNDAVQAGRAAISGGMVPGGGAALVHAAAAFNDGRPSGLAQQILAKALQAPLRQLALNSDIEPAVAVQQVRALPFGHGLDMVSRRPVDLHEAGVVDPVDVVIAALVVASSIARTCLRCEWIIAQKPLPRFRRLHHPHGHHHHGDPAGHTH